MWERHPACDVAHMPTQRCPLRLCDQIDGSGKVIVRGRHDQAIEPSVPEDAISDTEPAGVDVGVASSSCEEVDASPQARIEVAKEALTQAERSKKYRKKLGDEYRLKNAARMARKRKEK